jgi:YD repeat-containing protein
MKRKLIEWTIFGIIAVGLVLFLRWFVPRTVVQIGIATGMLKPTPRQLDPGLRKRLREEETRLAKTTPATYQGPSGIPPCVVLPVKEGIGEAPRRGIPELPGRGPIPPGSPFRDCLDLVPGGPPVNAAEISLEKQTVMFVQTDLYLPGDPPIAFTHVVMPEARWNWKSQNQIYLPDEYLAYPTGHRNPYTDQTLWLADTRGVLFNRISKGTGYADAVYKHTATRSLFYNALAGWNGNAWDYDLPDGRTLVFPDSYYAQRPQEGSIVGLLEPSGASLTFERDREGNLQEVRASDGRWMKFHYQGPFIVSIEDNAGERTTYSYDGKNRLSYSTNSAGEKLAYRYNASGGLLAVENVKTKQRVVSVAYNPNGPTSLQVDGGTVYSFSAELHVNDDRGHQWVVTCGKFTDNGCQYEVSAR